jgi:signal transduction histidine kinase
LELSLSEWVTSEGKFFTGIIRDITQRKKSEEEILMKNELLQAINAEKDKFFSILAHDLRGPLSAFVAATMIITEEIQTMEIEEIKELTGSMKRSAENIYRLLENLLEWSRLRRGGMEFIPEKINLGNKIKLCTEILSEFANNKGIEIILSVPDDFFVIADNHMLDATIRNLISNAIKFTPTGGKISVTAEIKKDNEIEIRITDTGIGMTQDIMKKLFHLNEKTNRLGTEGEPSTGLGLLLCKEFIEKQEGKIWVESEVGKGSSFFFSLPATV